MILSNYRKQRINVSWYILRLFHVGDPGLLPGITQGDDHDSRNIDQKLTNGK